MSIEPGKRYWRADGKLTQPLLTPDGHPPAVVAVEPQGRGYDGGGNLYPPLPPAHADAAPGLRLVREYVPPVEVFTDYRVRASNFEGMTIRDTPGSGCVMVNIPASEAGAETLRVWAAVMLDMAETLDKLPG